MCSTCVVVVPKWMRIESKDMGAGMGRAGPPINKDQNKCVWSVGNQHAGPMSDVYRVVVELPAYARPRGEHAGVQGVLEERRGERGRLGEDAAVEGPQARERRHGQPLGALGLAPPRPHRLEGREGLPLGALGGSRLREVARPEIDPGGRQGAAQGEGRWCRSEVQDLGARTWTTFGATASAFCERLPVWGVPSPGWVRHSRKK